MGCLVGVLVVFAALSAIGVAVFVSIGEQAERVTTECQQLTYMLDGSAESVSVTMTTRQGGTEQLDAVGLPFERDMGCWREIDIASLVAQNQGQTGEVRCRITRGGSVVASSTSSGAFVVVSCAD